MALMAAKTAAKHPAGGSTTNQTTDGRTRASNAIATIAISPKTVSSRNLGMAGAFHGGDDLRFSLEPERLLGIKLATLIVDIHADETGYCGENEHPASSNGIVSRIAFVGN
jgi:hypothetical protein